MTHEKGRTPRSPGSGPVRLVAPAARDGETVQRLLHDEAGLSHSAARARIAAGLVKRNGHAVSDPAERVAAGDVVEAGASAATRVRALAAPRRGDGYLSLHEDEDVVVVVKDAGILTVPAPSGHEPALTERIASAFRKRGFRRTAVLAVHRIDRFTSGLVVLARSPRALISLRGQFSEGTPERIYLAVAEGRVGPDRGRLVHRLVQDPKTLKVHATGDGRRGRGAACSFRVLERFDHATLLEITLETGRRNQIRVQLAAEGNPLVGDASYGRPSPWIGRTALHAARLAFDHPTGSGRMSFESAPPADFRRLVAAMRRGERPDPEGRAHARELPPRSGGAEITRPRGRGRRCR